jgi:phospholipid/cholesterol/gamma-HCH transport system permease protein
MKQQAAAVSRYTLKVTGQPGQEVILAPGGQISLDNLAAFLSEVRGLLSRLGPSRVTLDLEEIDFLDTAATLMLTKLAADSQAAGVPLEFARPSPEARRMLGLVSWEAILAAPGPPAKPKSNLLERLGDWTLDVLADFVALMTFLGALIMDLLHLTLNPRQVRWDEVVTAMKRVGVDGLPIITLLSFLLGLIVAFLSAMQLKQFGANIYVADLTAIAMVQELGPIMTGVMVAGRSGSAFAAEIGTMKVNEEVDALTIMGFDPLRFLAVPKVMASLVVLPLLTYYANLFGILGGMVVGLLYLDLTPYTFLKEVQVSIALFDIAYSTVKCLVFAVLIAGIGCQRGFQVRGGAEAVGAATTSAVVASIFMIIIMDSAFAVARQYLRPPSFV